ncbi:MAG: serine/threonine protein kinase [Fimbriiglobus sp.]
MSGMFAPRGAEAMPKLDTLPEFFDVVRRSGLVGIHELNHHLRYTTAIFPFAKRLVDHRLVTPYQARLLLAGRYKGFFLGAYTILDELRGNDRLRIFEARRTTGELRILGVMTQKVTHACVSAHFVHPGILRIVESGYELERSYFAMADWPQRTLANELELGGHHRLEDVLFIGRQLASALMEIHAAGYYGAWIHPQFLAYGPERLVRLMPWRLHRAGEAPQLLPEDVLALVETISPRVARNLPTADIRSDIYSLGALLFWLLTGRPIVTGTSTQKLARSQLGDHPRLRELLPDVPSDVEVVIEKMLSTDPSERYPAPEACFAALSYVSAKLDPRSQRLPTKEDSRLVRFWKRFSV